MKIENHIQIGNQVAAKRNPRRTVLVALCLSFCVLVAGQRSQAQIFPPQGDDTTGSMGVFRITVSPAFYSLVGASGALAAYPGYNSGAKKLTSPLCIDNATTIGRSSRNTRPYGFPVPIGLGSWDSIAGYGAYAAIPALWSGAVVGTEEVLTEIKSFNLSSVGGSAGFQCPPDPRIPSVPLSWPMVKAGTFAGVTPRSLGMVQENAVNGAANPDFPAHSFFDIFVEVNLPPIGATVSGTAFPGTGAVLYNDTPLIITNLSLSGFPPQVVYIHGETTAVPLKFKINNPPYWSAGDIFGYLVLAGHGTTTNADCTDTPAVNGFLNAVLGPVGTSRPELPIEWPRTNTLCPSAGASYDSAQGTNSDGSSIDEVKFPIGGGPIVHARNFKHSNLPNPISPPGVGGTVFYSANNTVVNFDFSFDGANWNPAQANGPVNTRITYSASSGGTTTYTTEMLQLNLTAGTLMIRESPSKQSLGKHTIRPDGTVFRISSFFDVFLELSTDGGASWIPADRSIRVQPSPPPAPLVLNCSTNITATASGPGGAVVNYTVTSSGGCDPVNIVCNPPSGSTFPVGTTVVTCTASDACGGTANCTFLVTVNQPAVQTPEYFSPTNSLPPTNSVYISPALWHALFANGIVIRDVRHRYFTQNQPPPALGATKVHTFGSQVDFEVSTDNGTTYHPASSTANVSVKVTHSSDSTSGSLYNTEMLQLDLVGPGFMLRESPTLQSTGTTKIRQVPGGYMISSFFDVFTELSTDNGATWMPAQQSAHVELRNDPRTVPTSTTPTTLLPPPNDSYVSPAKWHALYAQGIVIKDVSHKFFTGSLPPPAGGTNTHSFDSQLDMQVSVNGGSTFSSVRVAAPVQVTVASTGSGNSGMFDTEMLSLSISSGLPNGLMIRESPTEPSRGSTQLDVQPDGTQRISSFFDIWPEVSLDGGLSWLATTNGPVRMQLTPVAAELPASSPNLPVTNTPYVSPAKWHALFANGIIITNVSHSRFTQTQPPPPPGANLTENFGSTVDGQISLNGGASFTPFSAPASVTVQVNSRPDLDTGATRFFDTEMLSLDLSGGSLPAGMRLRESPSKASTGRTSERTTSEGYRINSFFDIFTEVSLDGGATWSPSTTGPATMTPRLTAKKRFFPNPNIPPTNGQYISPKQWHALYANGIIISNVTHKRFLANLPPPPPRSTNTHNFGSLVTLLIKLPGGQSFQQMTANADCVVSVRNSGQQGTEQVFQTEMLSLNLSGGTMPAGLMVRESPTRQSTGETRYSNTAGGYRIASFFDIFTEVSMDGGISWSPASDPAYMELHIDPGVPPTTLVNPHMQAGHPAFSLQSQTALQYLLQYKNRLTDPTWTTLGISPGSGLQLDLSDASNSGQSQRYYRVEVQEDDSQ